MLFRNSKYWVVLLLVLITALAALVQSCKEKKREPEPASGIVTEFQFKEKLSDYHFFEGRLNELNPGRKLYRYGLITPLFTDYAIKDRFIQLPAGTAIRYTAAGAFDFPDSTIIVKNFAYRDSSDRKIMIETRLLVKDPFDKKWKVMDYLWNKEQTDAIKHFTGAKLRITLLDNDNHRINTVYQVPNTNDCKRCHVRNDLLTPIGPKARNLNYVLPGEKTNQLQHWSSLNILHDLPAMEQVPVLPDWQDSRHYTLDQRARAYLDVNCAHCHTPGGDAYNTGLFLEYEQTDAGRMGMLKAPVSAGGGAGGLDYDIVPGDAAHSVLAYRMNSTEAGTAMPELARSVIHKEGVQLITAWINHLPKEKK